MWWKLTAIFMVVALFLAGCGSGDTEPILTEKLVGTPFEGKEIGTDFDTSEFTEGDYGTRWVDSLPIDVFLAYFTVSEEARIREGIEIANESSGTEVFRVTDEWNDFARLIYKVDEGTVPDSAGWCTPISGSFDNKKWAARLVMDWQIGLDYRGITKWVVAHELGHALGVILHGLIDYENDEIVDLEENSLMLSTAPENGQMNDYNYMMQMQTEILLNHLGEIPEDVPKS